MSFKRSIPNDILIQIFLELSVKSLSRLKCVSKEWCSIIENPEFVDSHRLHSYTRSGGVQLLGLRLNVRQAKNEPPVLFLVDPEGKSEPTGIPVRPAFCCRRILGISYGSHLCSRQTDGISYIEGLVCFGNFICNLSTKESIRLPEHWSDSSGMEHHFIGFDDSSKMYKVLSFCALSLATKVLTLGTNSWRDVFFSHRLPDDCISNGIYPLTKIYASLSCDNKIFLMIYSPRFATEHVILIFEVGQEKFWFVDIPSSLYVLTNFVLEVNGKFALIDPNVRTIFILEDYENKKWTRKNIDFSDYFDVVNKGVVSACPPSAISVTPVGTIHNGEILFEARKPPGRDVAFYFYYNLATTSIRQTPEHRFLGSVWQMPRPKFIDPVRSMGVIEAARDAADSIIFFEHVETIFRLKPNKCDP